MDWVAVASGVVAVATGIGLTPLLIWYCKWRWSRRRWVRFENYIDRWATQEALAPVDLTPDAWKSLCAIKLSEADFTPAEIAEHLDLAVILAQGRTALALGGDISKR